MIKNILNLIFITSITVMLSACSENRDSFTNSAGENEDSFTHSSGVTVATGDECHEDHFTGVCVDDYPSGAILYQIPYVDGYWEGVEKRYWENGNLHVEVTNVDDQRHGSFKQYYESGKLQISGQYSNGYEYGTWTYYDEEGGGSWTETY